MPSALSVQDIAISRPPTRRGSIKRKYGSVSRVATPCVATVSLRRRNCVKPSTLSSRLITKRPPRLNGGKQSSSRPHLNLSTLTYASRYQCPELEIRLESLSNLAEDQVGTGSPDKRLGLFVASIQIVEHSPFQLFHSRVTSPAHASLGDFGKQPFD